MTPEPDSKRQQQHLLPQLAADVRAAQGGLTGLMAKGARTSASSSPVFSPMSFSDALNKAKAAAETEKAWEGNAAPCTQTMVMASQPRNMLEDEEDEEKEEVELCMPGSFDFGFADPVSMGS